jgi:hypothetical protein
VTLQVSKGYPPDHEFPIAEISDVRDGGEENPAVVDRENGELRITIYERSGGVAWQYPLDDWIEAVQKAAKVLDEG